MFIRSTKYYALLQDNETYRQQAKNIMDMLDRLTNENIELQRKVRSAELLTSLYKKEAIAADKKRMEYMAENKLLRQKIGELENV